MSSNIKFTDNSDKVFAALSRQKRAALEEVGLTAERHAKEILTYTVYTVEKEEEKNRSYVLTGRLRNSITFAISGGKAAVDGYKDFNEKEYSYEGQMPQEKEMAVYIGTNVKYARGIEEGTHRKKGAVHFLRNAVQNYADEYRAMVKDKLS